MRLKVYNADFSKIDKVPDEVGKQEQKWKPYWSELLCVGGRHRFRWLVTIWTYC